MCEANIRRKPPPCQVGFLTSAETVPSCRSAARGFDHGSVLGVETRVIDTPAPSVLSHEILHSNPYTYLDDAPLEERRARAVALRRMDPDLAGGLGALDEAAIASPGLHRSGGRATGARRW